MHCGTKNIKKAQISQKKGMQKIFNEEKIYWFCMLISGACNEYVRLMLLSHLNMYPISSLHSNIISSPPALFIFVHFWGAHVKEQVDEKEEEKYREMLSN